MSDTTRRSVGDEIDSLDSDLDHLSTEIACLTEDLVDFLAGEQDSPDLQIEPPSDDAAGAYTRIIWRRQRIQRLTGEISTIRARLDV